MANNQSKSTWGGTLGLAGLVLAGCAVVVALATYMFGYVSGYEFNPQTFERRRFSFYEIPLLRLQVTPLARTDASGAVENLVRTNNYVTPTKGAPEEWHLVSFRRSTYKPVPTDPLILQRYFDAQDADHDPFWQEWSTEHPGLAKILWPEVARFARLDLYILLPPLFELAREAKDAKAFEAELISLQSKQLSDIVERLKKQIENTENVEAKTRLQKRLDQLSKAAEAVNGEQFAEKVKELRQELAEEREARSSADGGLRGKDEMQNETEPRSSD